MRVGWCRSAADNEVISMPNSCNRTVLCLALTAIAVCGCDRGRGYEGSGDATAALAAQEGRVAPLQDDTSEGIVSWVDGQPVNDWTAEISKRDQALQRYLADTDPGRAQKYGFRAGQNPQLAWRWFVDNPVGFNGVPFVLLKTILDLDPNHPNPTLRTIARIWKREPSVPA